MGLAGAEVLELHLALTEILGVAIHACLCMCVCVCVYLCSVNYAHTYQSIANEPLNLWVSNPVINMQNYYGFCDCRMTCLLLFLFMYSLQFICMAQTVSSTEGFWYRVEKM